MYFKNDFFHGASYQRIRAVASVLERFVAASPDPVGIGKLAGQTAMPPAETRKICANLGAMGLIRATAPDQWTLAGAPGDITLEDAWQAVLHDQGPRRTMHGGAAATADAPADDIDLLLGQALLAINQSISAQLRKCQLDRIKAAQCGFCVTRR